MTPVPHNPQKARIGDAKKNPNPLFAHFHMANMLQQDRNREKGRQVGYTVHAHCWVLVDRVIGHELMERSLGVFVKAVEKIWKRNSHIWGLSQFDDDYDDDSFYTFPAIQERFGRTHSIRKVDLWLNPVNVPEIHRLIERAIRNGPKDDSSTLLFSPSLQQQNQSESSFIQIPLEIAVLIVDTIYEDDSYGQASIQDT